MSGQNPIPREQAYEGVKAVNPPDVILSKRDPNASDKRHTLGSFWLNTISKTSFQAIGPNGQWAQIGGLGGALNTFTAEDAVVIAPIAGNIDIIGDGVITTEGSAGTVTVSISDNPIFNSLATVTNLDVGQDLNVLNGDVNVSAGDITVTGFISASSSIETTNGNLRAINGDLELANGDALLAQGDLVASLGKLEATAGPVIAGTTVTAGTGITTTAGNISAPAGTVTAGAGMTVTSGNALISDGDVLIDGPGKQLRIHGGAVTDSIGTATLVAGTVTVLNTNIAAGDVILLQRQNNNASTTTGQLVYTINAGVSFVVNSTILGTPGSIQVGDLCTFKYLIVRQV